MESAEGQNEILDFKKWGVDIIPHRISALLSAMEETEKYLRELGFAPNRLTGAKGFA